MTELKTADVLSRFALLAGLDDGAEKYQAFCEDAAREIERGERDGCGAEASGPLTAAAAALACYRFALVREGCGGGSFETGDVKVTPGTGSAASARKLWSEAVAAASPYLADVCFLFRRTSP
jgi:hypothetical protein